MNKPFPRHIIRHEALTPTELAQLFCLDPEEYSRSSYTGLLAAVEGVIQSRVPAYRAEYIPKGSTAQAECYALCASLLHEEHGFTPDVLNDSGKVVQQGEIGKGREWLKYPHPPIDRMLAFYLRLRDKKREYQLTRSANRAA